MRWGEPVKEKILSIGENAAAEIQRQCWQECSRKEKLSDGENAVKEIKMMSWGEHCEGKNIKHWLECCEGNKNKVLLRML